MQRDAGLVEDPRGRVVVRGEHRRGARRRRSACAMSATVRRRGGVGRGAHAQLRPVCAARVTVVQRAGDPVEHAVGDLALRQQRQLVATAGRVEDRRPGSSPSRSPEPGSATSLATSRSTPLRRSLSAARSSEPVSAANPTRTGRGAQRLVRRRRRSRSVPRAIRAISARMSGVGSSSRVSPRRARACVARPSPGRKSATAAAMTSASNPARPPSSWVSAVERGAQVGRRLDAHDVVALGRRLDLHVRGDERDAGAAVQRRLGDRHAHPPGRAVADEADRVDRLARAAGA